jgi:two-component sensor histidine kinase
MPRRGLDYALKAAGLESKFKLDMSTEAVLGELYEEVIGNAISFGCSNAKRRKVSPNFVCSSL